MKDLYTAELRIGLGDEEKYIRILDKNIKYKRGNVEIKNLDGILVRIKAQDPTALVASLNSVIKQLRVIESVSKVVKGAK